MQFRIFLYVFLLTCCYLVKFLHASVGDSSVVFNECLDKCWLTNCTLRSIVSNLDFDDEDLKLPNLITNHDQNQPYYLKLLGWDCAEECKYKCMWDTVEMFQNYGIEIPQFYGKWPFVRVMGIQEPASALASVLNFAVNFLMFQRMRKKTPRNYPYKQVWNLFAFVSLNTWFWSAVFHTKDTPFTERMDYFSAFALILVQFNSFFIRVFKLEKTSSAKIKMYSINLASCLYYLYHVYYLSSVKFDYGYNMQMNILFGVLNSICWLVWCYDGYFLKKQYYVWRCALSVILFDVLMVFEVFDFSPWFWTIDSHALWHLSTVFLPYLWYNFLIDDSYFFIYTFNYTRL